MALPGAGGGREHGIRSGFGNVRGDTDNEVFGNGYRILWNGGSIVAGAQEAVIAAINDIVRVAAELARISHIWENDSGQTEAAIYSEDARVEDGGTWVWGHWGVRDRPRIDDRTGLPEGVSTVDVACFLEFGTVRMSARPWIYPVFDATKVLLKPNVEARMRLYMATLRGPGGRFTAAPGWRSG